MNAINLNNAVELYYPEGFHVLSADERSELNFIKEGNGDLIRDEERHVLISAAWAKINAMARLLLNSKDVARSSEKVVAKAMSNDNYRLQGFRYLSIGGKEAQGYCYNYDKDGLTMYGESFCLKIKDALYYFHFYVRDNLKEENLPMWEEMLNGAKWL